MLYKLEESNAWFIDALRKGRSPRATPVPATLPQGEGPDQTPPEKLWRDLRCFPQPTPAPVCRRCACPFKSRRPGRESLSQRVIRGKETRARVVRRK